MGTEEYHERDDHAHWRRKAATLLEYAALCERTGLAEHAPTVREAAERCRLRAEGSR